MPLPPANPSTTPPVTSASYWGNYSNSLMPTLNGVKDYVNQARVLLQDLVPEYRYGDQELVDALNITLLDARRLRSDLFVYNLKARGQTQSFILNPETGAPDDTYVEIEPAFRIALLHGVCGHAMERDQEDFADSRATAFINRFVIGLIGMRPNPMVGGAGPGRPGQ